MYLDKVKGIISDAQFISISESIQQDKSSDDRRLGALREELEKELSKIKDEEQRQHMVAELISFDSVTRELVDTFIRYIEVGGTKNDRIINIFWNF